MSPDKLADACIERFRANHHRLQLFGQTVAAFFEDHPELRADPSAVHSVKWRMKDEGHLRDKVKRKIEDGKDINPDNFFQSVTDLAGVRVLHLHQAQFPCIHRQILKRVEEGDWILGEDPKAFSWDPESKKFFEDLGLITGIKRKRLYLIFSHEQSHVIGTNHRFNMGDIHLLKNFYII